MAVRVTPKTDARRLVTSYEDATDEQLMLFFQNGDDRAFDCLMRRHIGLIWRVARTYLGPRADIDDLIQDVSLTFWQNKKSWEAGQGKFSTWLYRVVSNKCIDLIRKKRESSTEDGVPEYLTALPATAEESLEKRQISDLLARVLADIPAQQALALRLYYFEEKEISDIAESLSVSEVAARSLLKRGKQNLRGLIPDRL
jgi:RNA polymerase sigma-70 factor (ECF subfamily)